MIGAIKVALAEARRAVEPMLRTRPSADRRWCYVPTEEIHEASQRALRGADLELFVEGSDIEGETLTVAYRLYKTAGDGIGHHEEYKFSILIDRGERRTTLTAGALAILDRRVRMSLLDIVSLPSEERQAAERPAVNGFIERGAAPRPTPPSAREAVPVASPEDLAAEADATMDDLTGPMPEWADADVKPDLVTADGPDTIEVWKRAATVAWIETNKVCANAGCDKPDLDAVIRGVAGPRADADDLDASGWSQVVVELGHIKARAVQAIVEGVEPC